LPGGIPVVGSIIHSAQIDPIHPRPLGLDESAEAGTMNDGPYNAWLLFLEKFGTNHVVTSGLTVTPK
jgi:hypothetical protein